MTEQSAGVADIHWLMDMLQTVDVGLVIVNEDYRIQLWNGFMENHSGLTPRQVREHYLFDLFPEIDEDWLRRKCDPVFLLKNRAFTIWEQRPYIFRFNNYRPITGNADYMYQNSTIFPITDSRGEVSHLCFMIYDVTDAAINKLALQQTNQQLRELSSTDYLTQIRNRGNWEEHLKLEFDRLQRYSQHHSSLIMCDIDHFKKVNDTYGHAAGDLVIQRVSEVIRKSLRTTDIAGRYGGEEFAILLLDTTADQAQYLAERVRRKIEQLDIMYNQQLIKVTMSFGLVERDVTIQNCIQWIETADKALYQSKQNGRNQVTLFKA
ncbi:sensor domain-containing diguanylate cyclase [Rheinheimera sp. UJ63]|uniref:sensor domain-containing diguanylate cyclase n=1 Tax=Rheinheimera sp. UJ63 TaxID=2910157 RepID=UPI001F289C1C|nr:diguanylate cyclase [Rheinheimera sp. UJ63]MCF4008046.1 diguanylate cyclase [Rheinheimera sp. UJ63]